MQKQGRGIANKRKQARDAQGTDKLAEKERELEKVSNMVVKSAE